MPPKFERFLMVKKGEKKKYRKLSYEDKFKFSCHKGLECFGKCCGDVNIFLTPYDVMRLKKTLNIASGEFLKKYTVTLLTKQKLSLVLLKMKEDEHKSCPFSISKECSVYGSRPWACRMYPLENTPKTSDPADGDEYSFIVGKDSPCLGIKENREWTIPEWFSDQGIDQCNQKNAPYEVITRNSMVCEGEGLTLAKAQMFYVALYNLDRFRELLYKSSFFERFEVADECIEKMKENDEELLNFGYEWLKFSLFGEKSIKIKEQKPTKRKGVLPQTKGKRRAR